jgi:excisionase family DNA binding protein
MLSIAEVAAAVGRTAKWVLARAATGDLPAVKVGGKIFIKRTELEAILGAPIELLEERDALDNPQHEGGNA